MMKRNLAIAGVIIGALICPRSGGTPEEDPTAEKW